MPKSVGQFESKRLLFIVAAVSNHSLIITCRFEMKINFTLDIRHLGCRYVKNEDSFDSCEFVGTKAHGINVVESAIGRKHKTS